MKRTAIALVVCVLGVSVSAQQIDDSAVSAAVKAGQEKKFKHLVADCNATAGFSAGLFASGIVPVGAYTVIVSLAPGRIAYAASEAKRLYKPFSAAELPAEMRDANAVFVTVEPHAPTKVSNAYHVPSMIERVVLKSKVDAGAVAQPLDFASDPREWSNLLGGKVEGNSAVSRFALSDLREMPAGDIDIVVVTVAGERRCKIGADDRKKLAISKSGS